MTVMETMRAENAPFCSLHVHLSGSGFSDFLVEDVQSEMPDSAKALVTGEHAPAAGPELLVSFVAKVFDCSVNVAIEFALKSIWNHVRDAARRHVQSEPVLSTVVIEYPSYSLTLIDHSFIYSFDTKTNVFDSVLIDEARSYVDKEVPRGCKVLGIVAPVDVVYEAGARTVVGKYSSRRLLLIHLARNGSSEFAVYDSTAREYLQFDAIGPDLL